MKVLHTVTFLCTIGFAIADLNVASVFDTFGIKPDILDESPRELVEVKFGDKFVNLGNELTPTEVKNIPEIHYSHEHNIYYTLVMTDPDAPSRADPTEREWHHWLVVNIPGEDITKGEVLAEFVSSAPGEGSGLHRYTFLVYKQPGKLEFDEPRLGNKSAVGRGGFSTKTFAAKYNLGNPVAGNLYQAQYDDYVLVVYEQLGI